MKKLVLLAFATFMTNLLWSQEPVIKHLGTLEKTHFAKVEGEDDKEHTFKVLGRTKYSLVIVEEITVQAFNVDGDVYRAFEQAQVIHFYDLAENKIRESVQVWFQKPKRADWYYTQDFPAMCVFKNRVYSTTNMLKSNTTLKKHVASKTTILTDLGKSIEQEVKILECPKRWGVGFSLQIADDSSCLYAQYNGFLQGKDIKKHDYGLVTFDENLNQQSYMPMDRREVAHVLEKHVILLKRGEKMGTSAKRGKLFEYALQISGLNGENPRSQSVNKLEIAYAGPGVHQIINQSNGTIEMVVGNHCKACTPQNALTLRKLTINTTNSATRLFKEEPLTIKRVTEGADGDQTEYQDAYFEVVQKIELNGKKMEARSIRNRRSMLGVASADMLIQEINFNTAKYFLMGRPTVIIHKVSGEIEALMVSNNLDLDYNHPYHPVIFDRDEYELFLLSNFSVPENFKNPNNTTSDNPQILQVLRLDIEEKSVNRINISGDIENAGDNIRYEISQNSTCQYNRELYCIALTSDGDLELAKIAWN